MILTFEMNAMNMMPIRKGDSMKKYLAFCILFLSCESIINAKGLGNFAGSWGNLNHKSAIISRIEIVTTAESTVGVRAWASCVPINCDMTIMSANAFRPREGVLPAEATTVVMARGYVTTYPEIEIKLIIYQPSKGRMRVLVLEGDGINFIGPLVARTETFRRVAVSINANEDHPGANAKFHRLKNSNKIP